MSGSGSQSHDGGNSHSSFGSMSRASSNHGVSASMTSKFEQVIFSVLYTMVKDNGPSQPILRFAFVVIDTLQIIGFAFSWNINWGSKPVEDIMKTANNPVSLLDSMLYYITLIAVLLAIFASFGNFYFVARDLAHGDLTWMWPVKTLRFLCTLSVTVFFMPFLNVLLVSVACEKNTAGILMMKSYPELQCWSASTIAPSIFAILALLVFIPSCIAFRLIFFNPDPLSDDPLARPLSRAETLWLVFKTALVLVFRLSDDTMLQAVVLTALSLIMLAVQLSRMPLYKRVSNHILAGAFGVDLGAGISMFIVRTGGFSTGALVTTFVVTMVVVGAIAVLASEIRWRRLVKRGLMLSVQAKERQEGIHGVEEMGIDAGVLARVASKKRAVLCTPGEAQLLARIVMCSTALSDDVADNIESLYQVTIEAFPRDASLHVAFGTFLFTYRGNVQLSTIQNRQAMKLSPVRDIRFLAYCSERAAFEENRASSMGEGRLDVITFLEFQKVFNQTQRYHQQTLSLMKEFWKTLGGESVNVADLRHVTDQISTSEKKATAAYLKILKTFPNNKQLYRSAAQFWAHVHHDYDIAAFYEEQAEELEGNGNTSDHGSNMNSTTNKSKHSQISWGATWKLDEATMVEHREYRENLKNRKSNAVERLSVVAFISLTALCVLAIANFVVVFQLLGDFDRTISIEEEVSARRYLLQTSLLHTTEMVTAKLQGKKDAFNTARSMLNLQMTTLNEVHSKLYQLSYGALSEAMDLEWTDMQLIFKPVADNTTRTYLTNQRTGGVIYLLMASEIAGATFEDIYDYQNLFDALNFEGYCLLDTPLELGEDRYGRVPEPKLANSFERTAFICTDEGVKSIAVTIYTQAGLFCFAVVLIIGLGIGFFRPALNDIREERVDTFLLFLTIPREVANMVGDAINDGSTRRRRKGKSGAGGEEKKDHKSKSGGSGGGGGNGNSESGGNDGRNLADRTDRKFRIRLFFALFLIAILFGITVIVTSVLLMNTQDTPVELNNAGRRRLMAQVIAFLGEALMPAAQKDPLHRLISDGSGFDGLKLELEKSITALDQVHRVLESGGVDADGWTISGVSRSEEQAYLSNEEQCMFNDPPCDSESDVEFVGMESILQYFVQQARTLSKVDSSSFMSTTLPQPLQEMVRVKPRVMEGLQHSTDLIADYAITLSADGKVNSGVLMCCIVITIFLLYAFLFRPIVKHLREESYHTGAMLLMIPPSAIAEVDTVRMFLETGELGSVAEQAASRAGMEDPNRSKIAAVAGAGKASSMKKKGERIEEVMGTDGLDLLRQLNEKFMVLDSGTTIRAMSPELLSVLGYAEGDVVGDLLETVVPDEIPAGNEAPGTVASTKDDKHDFVRTHLSAVLNAIASKTEEFPKHPPVSLAMKAGTRSPLFLMDITHLKFEERPCLLIVFKDAMVRRTQEESDTSSTEHERHDSFSETRSTHSAKSLLGSLKRKASSSSTPVRQTSRLNMSSGQISDADPTTYVASSSTDSMTEMNKTAPGILGSYVPSADRTSPKIQSPASSRTSSHYNLVSGSVPPVPPKRNASASMPRIPPTK